MHTVTDAARSRRDTHGPLSTSLSAEAVCCRAATSSGQGIGCSSLLPPSCIRLLGTEVDEGVAGADSARARDAARD